MAAKAQGERYEQARYERTSCRQSTRSSSVRSELRCTLGVNHHRPVEEFTSRDALHLGCSLDPRVHANARRGTKALQVHGLLAVKLHAIEMRNCPVLPSSRLSREPLFKLYLAGSGDRSKKCLERYR
jgi:hypothetical protein